MKYFLPGVFFVLISFLSGAQDTTAVDSAGLRLADSARFELNRARDSAAAQANRQRDSANAAMAKFKLQRVQAVLQHHPYFSLNNDPLNLPAIPRKRDRGDEFLFYGLLGLILFFALIKLFFSRYVNNLFSLFFRVTMRQQQIREQMLQTPLASLLLNIQFVLAGALYLSFLAFHYELSPYTDFWLVFLYCMAFVASVYTVKFIFLKFVGWIFGVSAATDTYIFVVFLVNKMIGMLLLPILVLMAFPHGGLYPVTIVISFVLLILLFLYRFFISYGPIRSDIKVNKFHFFIYLCAFEIAPLLLIYKVLLNFVERST